MSSVANLISVFAVEGVQLKIVSTVYKFMRMRRQTSCVDLNAIYALGRLGHRDHYPYYFLVVVGLATCA